MRETQAAKAAAAQAQGNVVAYGAVVFDGEPAAAAAFYEDLIRSKVAR